MVSPDPEQEVAEEVRKRVAKRMRQLPIPPGTPGEEDSSTDEDEPAPMHRQKNLKSGMERTWAPTVLNKITLPHEVVYTSAGKPTSYHDISVTQFIY